MGHGRIFTSVVLALHSSGEDSVTCLWPRGGYLVTWSHGGYLVPWCYLGTWLCGSLPGHVVMWWLPGHVVTWSRGPGGGYPVT